jgi:dihydrofolate synthase/folylpolyglutamate synthase
LLSYQQNLLSLNITLQNNNQQVTETYTLDLPGLYQTNNLITVLTSVEELRSKGWNLPKTLVQKALSQTKKITGLHGRWELLHQHPNVIADVAHNEAGIQQLLQQIAICSFSKLHIVFGMVKDKDADKILALLPNNAQYYFTQAQIPRALDKLILRAKAQKFGLIGQVYNHVNEAIEAALQCANTTDMIVVCGSVFLIAEIEKSHWKLN